MRILKNNKVNTLLVSIIMMTILLCCSSQVQAAQDGDYTYTVTDGKAQITKYIGTAIVVTIPDTLGGAPVTSIGDEAFSWCRDLTEISLPQGVTSIGQKSFCGCNSLSSIIIPQGVTSIGQQAFSWCTSLTSITIPDSETSIGNYAFADCTKLTTVNLQQGVTNIGDGAFSCTSITEISLPQGITSIGASIFYGCTHLKTINLPQGVTSIGNFAFSNCTGLTNISLPQGVTSIGNGAFSNCTGLTNISLPQGVTSIGNDVFSNCTGLTNVSLPQGVTSIGNGTFRCCTSITEISLPQGVASIGDYAFYDCYGLSTISLPQGVASIGDYAFADCTGLTAITLPQGAVCIGDYAFADCTDLTAITLPQGVTSIGAGAFSSCAGLTSIILPESVTSIGDYAFADCTGLTSFSIPQRVTSIGFAAFARCTGIISFAVDVNNLNYVSIGGVIFNKAGTKLILCPANVTALNIPQGVTSIGDGAFYCCKALSNISLPEGVTSIGDQSFYYCSRLTSISIPQTVTSIGDQAFFGCEALANIRFNSATTTIYDNAYTIPYCTEIIGYDPSTSKTYASRYQKKFEVIGGTITGVRLDLTTTTIIVGTSEPLTATISPINAKNIGVSWKSSNDAIATVDTNGKVEGVKVGTAVITVTTLDRNKSASCTVNVIAQEQYIPITSVNLDKTNITLSYGSTEKLVATILPTNATNKKLTWFSSDPSVATVDSTGLVRCLGVGYASIKVLTEDDNIFASCDLDVTPVIKSLQIEPGSLKIAVNETEVVRVNATYTDNTNDYLVDVCTWSSSNPDIAVYDPKVRGVVGKKKGTATITASCGGKKASIKVRVTPPIRTIQYEPSYVAVTVGQSQSVKMFLIYDDDTREDITKLVEWRPTDTSIATVTRGVVTGVSVGDSWIYAIYNEARLEIPVKVAPALKSISIDRTSVNLMVDEGIGLVLLAKYADGSEEEVTGFASGKSSNPNIVEVTNGGSLRALKRGTAKVTLTFCGKRVTTIVKVTPDIVKIVADPVSLDITQGKTQAIKVYVTYKDNTKEEVSKLVNWWSADTSVAIVNGRVVTGVGIGETVVTGNYASGNGILEIPIKVSF